MAYQDADYALIQACRKRERWAMQHVYEEYFSAMMHVLVRYAKSEDQARDLVHDGFVKVFKNIHKYQPGSSMYSWIKRIMVNTAIDHIRKQKRRRTDDLDNHFDIKTSAPDAIEQISQKELLEIIRDMSPTYRAVFNLYIIEGYSHGEISSALGISESTSRSNLVKARKFIKSKITRYPS